MGGIREKKRKRQNRCLDNYTHFYHFVSSNVSCACIALIYPSHWMNSFIHLKSRWGSHPFAKPLDVNRVFYAARHIGAHSSHMKTTLAFLLYSMLIEPAPYLLQPLQDSALHNPKEPGQFFHILIVPSSLPVAYNFPSGEKLMLQIGP